MCFAFEYQPDYSGPVSNRVDGYMSDFWVFGYGSLIWNPGFEVLERRRGTLYGLHRSLCIHSWVHRGTRDKPGLVLGLDRGGACAGVVMKAPGDQRTEIIDYLRGRELVTDVYLECWRKVFIPDLGRTVDALVYRADRKHEQYAKGLASDDQAQIVSLSKGRSGDNRDYVTSTVEALRREGIHDAGLEHVHIRLIALTATA